MSYFKNICLLKAPHAVEAPHPTFVSDFTEISGLAAVVEKDVESVSIPESFYHEGAFENFRRFLERNPADLVGISSMTGAFNNALALAKIAKEFGKYVIMGGNHPSALPDEVLKSPHVDALILGEGEATFKDFVLNGPEKKVPGMAFKENGRAIFTESRPLIDDLSALPYPLRKARPTRFGESGANYSIDTVYTSRGCPYQCTFCANNTINKKWRARDPEHVVGELATLHEPGRKKLIKIGDANFLTSVSRVEKICDLMIRGDLTNFKLWTETSVNDIIRAEKIMPKLRKVGMGTIGLGIESPNAETRKKMKKNNKEDSCARAVDILTRHKIKTHGFFVLGHHTETEEDTENYPKFARAIGLKLPIFFVLTPYPGTVIYDEYRRENKIKSYDWDSYNNFGTVVETKSMNIKTLKRMVAYCCGIFFNRYSFLKRSTFLEIIITPMLSLVFMNVLFRLNRENSRDEIKDLIFYALETGATGLSRRIPVKPLFILRLFKDITIRIRHSPGKNLDFSLSQDKDARYVKARLNNDQKGVRGITLNIDKAMRLGERASVNQYAAIACKFEILKNLKKNPMKKWRYLLTILFSREFMSILCHGLFYILSTLIQGFGALVVGLFFVRKAKV